MNKAELINAAAEKAGLSKKDTESVQMVGFGAFDVRRRAARKGRNPRAKEGENAVIDIPASKVPVFKPGKALKDAVAKE